jgi:hypothetical protein
VSVPPIARKTGIVPEGLHCRFEIEVDEHGAGYSYPGLKSITRRDAGPLESPEAALRDSPDGLNVKSGPDALYGPPTEY